MCLTECRRGVQMCDTGCAYAVPQFEWPGPTNEWFYLCERSGVLFRDLGHLVDAAMVPVAEEPGAVTDNLEEEHYRRYGARIRITNSRGDVYTSLGYEQRQLKAGLVSRVEGWCERTAGEQEGPLRVLEVGCSSGFLLGRLRELHPDWSFVGVDPSPVAASQAQEFYGLDVRCGTVADVLQEEEGFDCVVMLGNLMLHPNPEETLRRLYAFTRPGGILVFDSKNPKSLARRALGAVARQGGPVGSVRWVRRAVERAFNGMRFGMDQGALTRIAEVCGWEVMALQTVPPRLLEYENTSWWSGGAVGAVWSVFDRVDAFRGERAWVELVCRRG